MSAPTEAPAGHKIQAAGITLHYHDVGQGPPIIMLHGAGPGATAWSNFKQNVGELSRNFRCLLVDLPQFGGSEKVVITTGRSSYTANVLADFLKQLGIERSHFIGNSMGGQAAIKLAIDRPELVDKLVVIGSTPVGRSIFCPMPLEGIKHIINYYRGGASIEKMRALVEVILFDHSFIDDETIQERYEASIDPEVVEVMTGRPPEREELTDQLHKVAAPTLIVWGLDDRLGAMDIGLFMLSRFQNARMHIFNRCGHWAQVEHAGEFNRLVSEFLANPVR